LAAGATFALGSDWGNAKSLKPAERAPLDKTANIATAVSGIFRTVWVIRRTDLVTGYLRNALLDLPAGSGPQNRKPHAFSVSLAVSTPLRAVPGDFGLHILHHPVFIGFDVRMASRPSLQSVVPFAGTVVVRASNDLSA
jgi:hypothetical protein